MGELNYVWYSKEKPYLMASAKSPVAVPNATALHPRVPIFHITTLVASTAVSDKHSSGVCPSVCPTAAYSS